LIDQIIYYVRLLWCFPSPHFFVCLFPTKRKGTSCSTDCDLPVWPVCSVVVCCMPPSAHIDSMRREIRQRRSVKKCAQQRARGDDASTRPPRQSAERRPCPCMRLRLRCTSAHQVGCSSVTSTHTILAHRLLAQHTAPHVLKLSSSQESIRKRSLCKPTSACIFSCLALHCLLIFDSRAVCLTPSS